MDDNSRPRRQNERSYQGTDPRFHTDAAQVRDFSTSSSERFRPTPITAAPTTSRRIGGTTAYSGYYEQPSSAFPAALSQSPMQYQPNYQDQRQSQSFATYSPDIIYSAEQPTPPSAVYGSNTQFQTRQPAAMQMLSGVAAPYFSNDSTAVSGAPTLPPHASSSSSIYQHSPSPADRGSLLPQPSYPGAMNLASMSQTTSGLMDADEFQQQGPGMEAAYTAYQTALKEIFQNIFRGQLSEASQSLLDISEWLLGHVSDLGLTIDEAALRGDRIRLWGEFNTAWLSIFQKQKDMLHSGHRIQQSQSFMTQEFINKMAKDLIRMCDSVEKHGLVDYQYGVAEEQIIMILTECLDLQESIQGIGGDDQRAAP